jgi:lipid II:glycine glycyltransferase (peptidoglycan interpeptide bridge formation enzyme)
MHTKGPAAATSDSDPPCNAELIRDPIAWDELVQSHPHAGFMQSAGWGYFRRHLGWSPYRLCLQDPDRASAPAAQVLFRRVPKYNPFTIGYLPRGPLLDYSRDDQVAAMLQALDRLARRVRAVVIIWELPVAYDPTLAARLQRLGLRPAKPIQHTSTRVLDLTPSLEEIQAGWKPKWRYNTRLAAKHGVQVRHASSPDDLARWHDLYLATCARDHFVGRGADYFRRFWERGRATGDTVLLLAEHADTLLAGIMVHQFGREATYLYGADGRESRQLMPNYLLQWEALQWAKSRGATRYDLFGIADTDDEHEPLAGVSRFKAGYGGEAIHYAGAYARVYHPLLYAALQRMRSELA